MKRPFAEISEERKNIVMKVCGLCIAVAAVFTLISVLSFMFTWKADQSLAFETEMLSQSVPVHNSGGKLGYSWGHFLVGRCFGLGSLAIVYLLWALAMKLFFQESRIRIVRVIAVSFSGAVLFSLIISYFSILAGSNTAFGFGLGGACGTVVIQWMKNLVGSTVTFFLLVLFSVVWLLAVSGRFSRWLQRLGKHDENTDASANTELKAESGVKAENETGEPAEASVENIGQVKDKAGMSSHDESLDNVGETVIPKTVKPEIHSVQSQTDKISVINTTILDRKVNAELPRINNRDELEYYQFPSLELLSDYSHGRHEVSSEELDRNNNKIRATLMNFKIQVDKVTAIVGPTVTLYKLYCAPGVKISAIKNLEDDIAMALNTRGVRVVKLTDAVGIEVANDRPSIVPLKAMLNDDAFRNSKAELPIALGYTITQKVKTFDLADAPHLLVAGATKQGKSVGLNVIITSLLYSKHPSELKFVFIDPKMVEFSEYSKLIHHYLAVMPTAANENEEKENAIVKHPKQADEILRSLCVEMDERYMLLSRAVVNNIKAYNEKYRNRLLLPTEGHKFLPYLVVVIDEYADLTMTGGASGEARATARSITNSIVRLAQKGRAAGIHVIIATQRPSVDVITGLIKTNFPTRIAFRTVTRVDSSTILDANGAEKLIGRGDMLYYAGVEMERVQCALVEMSEIGKITTFIGSQSGYKKSYSTPYYLPELESSDSESGAGMVDMQNLDSMFEDAARMVVQNQQGSTSTLQRKLGMGYARAGRVMDQLEAAGIVGPQEGSKPRQVLVADFDELEKILNAYLKNTEQEQ